MSLRNFGYWVKKTSRCYGGMEMNFMNSCTLYTTQRAYAYDGLGQINFVKLHWAAGNPAGLEKGVWEKEVKLIY